MRQKTMPYGRTQLVEGATSGLRPRRVIRTDYMVDSHIGAYRRHGGKACILLSRQKGMRDMVVSAQRYPVQDTALVFH